MRPLAFISVLSLSLLTAALPASTSTSDLNPLPLVIWHGLGDDYTRGGLKEIAALAESTNPGTYVHIIHIGDSASSDREATFLGNVTEQVSTVCTQLADDPILSTAPAVNAIGFSQGGQFLRAYVERCNSPPIRNLVTIGSQHNGIAAFQECSFGDIICLGAEAILKFGRWSSFVQSRFVPAQYFRDPSDLDAYLENSNFLADANNERAVKNASYKQNLGTLNRLAMYMFRDDTIVHPKESAWFAEVDVASGVVTPLRERAIYKEDWLGLKGLDEKGALEFGTLSGDHMQLDEGDMVDVFQKYFGPVEIDASLDQKEALVDQEVLGDL